MPRIQGAQAAEAQEQRSALAAGADVLDRRGRRAIPLGPSSIRKLIDTLAAILDDAVEDELIVAGEAQDALDLRYQGLRGVAGVDAALGFPAGHVYAPRGSASRS